MAARTGTGTKDWYAKFTREGKSAGKLGPYVTRRAALEDAKVVLRAKVRGLVDEDGESVRVVRVLDARKQEIGYEASDGSISAITASSGKATFNERVNPSAFKKKLKAADKAIAKAEAKLYASHRAGPHTKERLREHQALSRAEDLAHEKAYYLTQSPRGIAATRDRELRSGSARLARELGIDRDTDRQFWEEQQRMDTLGRRAKYAKRRGVHPATLYSVEMNPRRRNTEISVGSRVRVPQEHNYTGTVVRVGRPFEGAMLSYLVRFGSSREIWFTPEEVIHVNPRRSFGRMR